MNGRERFWTAFQGKQPDKVPITELVIVGKVIAVLAERLDIERANKPYVEIYCDVIENLGLDAVCYAFSMQERTITASQIRDKYGRIYNTSDHGEALPAKPAVSNLQEAEQYDMASKLTIEDFSDMRYIMDRFGKSKDYCMVLSDPYKEGWRTLGGMEILLAGFIENPELVRRVLRAGADLLLKAIDISTEMGIRAFIIPGDYAMETGLLFSPEIYRDFLKPLHREIVEHIHGRGGLVTKHSDGNNWDLLDDWIDVGFDGFHPVQPQCMDIREVKRYLNGKMSIWGNIDCRTLLVTGTEEEVRKSVKETIEIAGPGGGYIITSSNSIHPNVKPENYQAMVQAVHDHGWY